MGFDLNPHVILHLTVEIKVPCLTCFLSFVLPADSLVYIVVATSILKVIILIGCAEGISQLRSSNFFSPFRFMEESWEKWISSLEMGGDNNNSFGQSHNIMNYSLDEGGKLILTEIEQQQQPSSNFSFEGTYHSSSTTQHNATFNISNVEIGATTTTSTIDNSSSLSNKETNFDEGHDNNNMLIKSNNNKYSKFKPAAALPSHSHQTRYILSFEKSTVELPAVAALHRLVSPDQPPPGATAATCTLMNDHVIISDEPANDAKQGSSCCSRRFRSSSETKDRIVAERKRRQVLTERFIALSATIPGLKKSDKAYVLREAINYVKQLQGRVKELENKNKSKNADSAISIKKSQEEYCNTIEEIITSYEDNSNNSTGQGHRLIKKAALYLPQVEARVLEKEILIGIHCEKQKDIVLRIMALLQNLHLSLATCSVLPFGTSTLKVTIIAQMDDEYCMTVNDLVKNLRQDLLKVT